jgi:SNF2 family DNA or RNA helicase
MERACVKSYGTAILHERHWELRVEPHVAVMAKRMFPAIKRGSTTVLKIPDTLAHCRDLLWLCKRFPLMVDPAEYLQKRSKQHEEQASYVDALMSGTSAPMTFPLAIPPREYQRIAASLVIATRGILIADDVGLGKTASAICALSDARLRPALVVTLAHLPRQWKAEIQRFAPGMKVHILCQSNPYDFVTLPCGGRRGVGPPQRHRLIRTIEKTTCKLCGATGPDVERDGEPPDVVVTNYHKLSNWSDHLAKSMRTVIWDEVQELRKTDSAKYTAAKGIADRMTFRAGLSATPIMNYGSEIYAVMETIRPASLGSYTEFVSAWCEGDEGKMRLKEPGAFGSFLRDGGMMIRRTRKDVGRELPPVQIIPQYIDCDSKVLESMAGEAAELARVILSQSSSNTARFQAGGQFDMLMRQRTGIAKAPYVAAFVRLLAEAGERVVLFAWHREVYTILMEKLADLKPAMYTGSETNNQKDEAKRRFMAGESKVLILSLRSGAGLDGLQFHSRIVVFGELDWSPGMHEQCIGRVARDGQPDPVAVYYLLAEDGSDPVISRVLGVKTAQSRGLLQIGAEKALLEEVVDPDRIRQLAQAYLQKHGGGGGAASGRRVAMS